MTIEICHKDFLNFIPRKVGGTTVYIGTAIFFKHQLVEGHLLKIKLKGLLTLIKPGKGRFTLTYNVT